MGTELAQGYLSLSIGFKGTPPGKTLGAVLAGLDKQAQTSGKGIGRHLASGVDLAAEKTKASLARTEQAMASAAKAAEASASKRADAERKVAIEQAKLNELRDSGKAKASQLLVAEDRLARAKGGVAKADLDAAAAAKRASDASDAHRKALSNQGQAANRLGRSIPNPFGKLRGDAEKTGDEAGRGFGRRFASGAERSVKSSGGSVFKGMLGAQAVVGGLKAAAGALSGFMGEALVASDATDKFKQTLSFGGVDQGRIPALTAAAQKYADQTVYNIGDIQNVTAQLAANGVKGFDRLAEAAGNLNAVSGGNADTFKSVGTVLTQTAGAGKLTTENWNQLADAIPGASGRLQAAMLKNGAYTGNFRTAMEKGQITAEEFNAAMMQLGMEDTAVKAAKSTATFEGAWGNLQATISGGLAQVLTEMKPLLTGVLSGLASRLGPALGAVAGFAKRAAGGIKAFSDGFKGVGKSAGVMERLGVAAQSAFQAVGRVVGSMVPVVARVAAAVMARVREVVDWIRSEVAPRVEGIVTSVSGFFAVAGRVAGEFVTGMTARLAPMIPTIRNVFGTVGTIVTGAMDLIRAVIARVTGVIKFVWDTWGVQIMDTMRTVFSVVTTIIQTALGVIRGVIQVATGLISGDWGQAWAGVKGVAAAVWDGIKSLVGGAIDQVQQKISAVTGSIGAIWGAAWDGVKTKVSDIMTGVQGVVETGKSIIGRAWDGIRSVLSKPINGVISIINSGVIDSYNKVAEFFGAKQAGRIPLIDASQPVAGGGGGSASGRTKTMRFASGGVMPGYTPGRDVHRFWSPSGGLLELSGGEGILRPEVTRVLGPRGIGLLNAASRRGAGAIRSAFDALTHRFAAGGIVNFRGHRFTSEFAKRIGLAEKMVGAAMSITQGGFRPATSYSGTSHAGDALDIAGVGHQRFIPALRSVGIPTWDRTGKGNWISHSHGVPLPGSGMAGGSAVWQAQDYLRGGDGLGGRDSGPRPGAGLGGVASAIWENLKVVGSKLAYDFKTMFSGVMDTLSGVTGAPFVSLPVGMAKTAAQGVIDKAGEVLGFRSGGIAPGGLAALSEDGRPELVVGPQYQRMIRGSRVFNAAETSALMGGGQRMRIVEGSLSIDEKGRAWIRGIAENAVLDFADQTDRGVYA